MALNLLKRQGPPLVKEVTASMSPYDVKARDAQIVCDLSTGAITIRFSATAKRGSEHEVKGRGPAGSNVVTAEFPGSSVDGEADYEIGNDESVRFTKRIVSYAAS